MICCVPHCNSTIDSVDVSWFNFTRTTKRAKEWIKGLGLEDLGWDKLPATTIKHYKICSRHFDPKFVVSGKKQSSLTFNAVPSKWESNEDALSPKRRPFSNITNCNMIKRIKLDNNSPTMKNDEIKDNIKSKLSAKNGNFINKKKKKKKQQNQIFRMKKKLQNPSKFLTVSLVLQFLKSMLPEVLYLLVSACLTRAKRYHRWQKDEKDMIFSLYFKSPNYYSFLRNDCKFVLPDKSTIQKWLRNVKIPEGFTTPIIDLLAKARKEMKYDKVADCVLMLDEVSIKKNHYFDESQDRLYGQTDSGSIKSVIVFMLRGLYNNWKIPIGYFYSVKAMEGGLIKCKILEILKILADINYKVKMVTVDQGSNNRKSYRLNGITPEKPYVDFNSETVHFCYDIPHLIKSLRNNLARWDIVFNGKRISWSWVKKVYFKNRGRVLNLGKRINYQMVYPNAFNKMKVKNAVKIFSNNISSAIYTLTYLDKLPKSASQTAKFFKDVNTFFDIMNTKSPKNNDIFKRALSLKNESKVISFLTRFKDDCQKWRLEVKKGKKIILKKVPCFSGIVLTINSILHLWEQLKNEGYMFLMTNRTNQDPLENYFSIIRQRGGFCSNPTSKQFSISFNTTLLTRFLRPSKNSNCFFDKDKTLLILDSFKQDISYNCNYDISDIVNSQLVTINAQFDKINLDLFDKNCILYVSGFIVKKVKQLDCKNCSKIFGEFINYDNFSNENVFIREKDYKLGSGEFEGCLFTSCEEFTNLLVIISKLFKASFETVKYNHPRCKIISLLSKLHKIEIFSQYFCSIHINLAVKLFINLLIKNYVRESNDISITDNKIVNTTLKKFKNK